MITMSVWKESTVSSPYAPRFRELGQVSSLKDLYDAFPADKYEVISAEYTTNDLRLYVRERRA